MIHTRFLEPAAAEIEEHVNYFDRQLLGLGDRFEQEVRYAVTIISGYPEIGSPLTRRIRKLHLRTFPYNVIYLVDGDEAVILAVAADSRRPNYWRPRLGSIR